jgi:predicted aspartyl protease
VTFDTGASVTISRPDIVAGLPERKTNLPYVLQTASGETIPVMREAHVELTLGRRPLRIWVLCANTTDELILGLDVLRDCNASVDVGRGVLRIGQEVVSLWNPRTRTRSSRLTILNDEVSPARCERVVLTRPGAIVKAASDLVEPSMKAPLKGLYITSTLFESRERVPVRIVNVADRDQVLSEGTVVEYVEPVVWTMPLGDQELPPPATQGPCEQLQGMISDAKQNLDATET